jgi:hypothetical protein
VAPRKAQSTRDASRKAQSTRDASRKAQSTRDASRKAQSRRDASNNAQSKQDGEITDKELRRVLDLLDAVRARDRDAKIGDGLTPVEIDRANAEFAHELISALTGRLGPELTPFARTLAQVKRTPGELQITLVKPADPAKPFPPKGSAVKVLLQDATSVAASVGDDGKVPVPDDKDKQAILGVEIRDVESRPIAVAGRIAALP